MEKEKPKPTVRTSGGNPNGLPDFRPINKLPESELRAVARRLVRPALYQVWVEDLSAGGAVLPKGPKCVQATAANFAFAIADQIRRGNEKAWRNPQIKLCL